MRLTEEEWAEVRALRESTGMSYRMLSEKFGVSDVAILKRSRKHGWTDGANANEVANRLAQEKAAGIIPNRVVNFEQRTQSINEAADKKAAVLLRQQDDWEIHRIAFAPPEQGLDADGEPTAGESVPQRSGRLRDAKIAAEMLRVRHEGERRAYGITDNGEGPKQGRPLSDFYGE